MKLGELKSAIKDGPNPKIMFNLGGTIPIEVVVQKGSLLDALSGAFENSRSVETGLYLREDGFIMREADRPAHDEP